MRAKAKVLEKSSFTNLVHFLIVKKYSISSLYYSYYIITRCLCVCVQIYTHKKTKGQMPVNFPAIQNLTQFTQKFPYLSYWF